MPHRKKSQTEDKSSERECFADCSSPATADWTRAIEIRDVWYLVCPVGWSPWVHNQSTDRRTRWKLWGTLPWWYQNTMVPRYDYQTHSYLKVVVRTIGECMFISMPGSLIIDAPRRNNTSLYINKIQSEGTNLPSTILLRSYVQKWRPVGLCLLKMLHIRYTTRSYSMSRTLHHFVVITFVLN